MTSVVAGLFDLGEVVATPGAIEHAALQFREFLLRHVSGDWGDISQGDKNVNDLALKEGDRILSAYHAKDGTKIWIITEADRSATTFLLPDEY